MQADRKIPFTYGIIADSPDFTNREAEQQQLQRNFLGGINTVLISPRRWGKSSLVNHCARKMMRNDKNIRFVFVDLFKTRNEQEFYKLYATELLRATSNKLEEVAQVCRQVFKSLTPSLQFKPSPEVEWTLEFNWKEVLKNPEEILNLSETLCRIRKLKIIVCIDEFQNISYFEDPLALQKKMRAYWQQHQKTTYCIYGSKRHMLTELFVRQSYPFYKFGQLIMLEKIAESHWIKFITSRFADSGKTIDPDTALQIATAMENHPYYVQQLAQTTWMHCSKKCRKEDVVFAISELFRQHSILFQKEIDGLTNPQIGYLHALIDQVEKFSSSDAIHTYRMGSSANVKRVRTALELKEIIDNYTEKPEFTDPLFKLWLRQVYFQK